jgi:hypothetical protein
MNTRNGTRALVVGATVVVLAAVVAGLIAIGPPDVQRRRKLDERRVADLNSLSAQVKSYKDQHKQLPADLAALAGQPGRRLPVDPETGSAYEYAMTDEGTYRLCANFALDSADIPQPHFFPGGSDWPHGVGRTCFDRQVTKRSGSD